MRNYQQGQQHPIGRLREIVVGTVDKENLLIAGNQEFAGCSLSSNLAPSCGHQHQKGLCSVSLLFLPLISITLTVLSLFTAKELCTLYSPLWVYGPLSLFIHSLPCRRTRFNLKADICGGKAIFKTCVGNPTLRGIQLNTKKIEGEEGEEK